MVKINVDSAVVTATRKFKTNKGPGLDVFIEAQSSNSSVYLQVVLYDSDAEKQYASINEGDIVNLVGELRVKTYVKNDGNAGFALLVERPIVFSKLPEKGSEQQPADKSRIETEEVAYPVDNKPARKDFPLEIDKDGSWICDDMPF